MGEIGKERRRGRARGLIERKMFSVSVRVLQVSYFINFIKSF